MPPTYVTTPAELLFMLRLIEPSLAQQDTIPVLTHFAFTGDTIYAFNDITATIVHLETGIKGAVPGKALLNLLATFPPDSNIKISSIGTNLHIENKNTKLDLPMLPDLLFKMPEQTNPVGFTLKPDIIPVLKAAVSIINSKEVIPKLTCLTLIREGKRLALYTTHSSTALLRTELGDCKQNVVAILPKNFGEQLLTLLAIQVGDIEPQAQIAIDGNTAIAMAGGVVTLVSKLFAEEPHKFARVVESTKPVCEPIDFTDGWPEAIKRACVFGGITSGTKKSILLSTEGNMIRVEGTGSGKLEDTFLTAKTLPRVMSLRTNPDQIEFALDFPLKHIQFCESALLMTGDNLLYIVSGVADQPEPKRKVTVKPRESANEDEDDIPF